MTADSEPPLHLFENRADREFIQKRPACISASYAVVASTIGCV